MKRVVVLDSGPLGEVINPQRSPSIRTWLQFIKESKISIRIAEIIDYELRRELTLQILHNNNISCKSISHLNQFRQRKQFIPLEPYITLNNACDIWANLRFNNQATADFKNIDIDTILIAQVLPLKDEFNEVIIATNNSSALCRFSYLDIKVWDWKRAIHDCKHKQINFYQKAEILINTNWT